MTQTSERLVRRASISERALGRASLAASVGLALMLVGTLGYIGWPRVAAALGVSSKPAPRPPAYTVGDTVDVPAAWYSTADTTLVLFARASCGACEKAHPFLTKIVGIMNSRGAAFMAHPAVTKVEDAQFAKSLGVKDANVVVGADTLKVQATPTILIVDRRGKILGAWEGVGTPDRQAAVLELINSSTR